MRLVYISKGNIPSKWAHTIQMMKMSEALNGLVDRFCLVTQSDWQSLLHKPFDYFGWYGIQKPFRIVRLPLLPRMESHLIQDTFFKKFDRIAVEYARLVGASLVYTRTARQALFCVLARQPVILEAHFGADWELSILAEICKNPYLRRIVTISPVLEHLYLDAGIPAKKILEAPDAVDLHRYHWDHQAAEIRVQLGLPSDRPIITYCGHLYEDRGIDVIVESAKKLTDLYFLFIGGLEDAVQSWKQRTSHLSNICFRGFVPNSDVPLFLSASDLLLMPYSSKCATVGWMSPLKLFEYMAARKAIIASDLASIRQVLTHGENAWLIPPDDGAALAGAISKLFEDRNLAQKLALGAYQSVQGHTWEQRAARILDGFRE